MDWWKDSYGIDDILVLSLHVSFVCAAAIFVSSLQWCYLHRVVIVDDLINVNLCNRN